jgi:hypothetical protein
MNNFKDYIIGLTFAAWLLVSTIGYFWLIGVNFPGMK